MVHYLYNVVLSVEAQYLYLVANCCHRLEDAHCSMGLSVWF